MEDTNANGFGAEILTLIIENHSWVEFSFLYIVAYLAIPGKSLKSRDLFKMGNDYYRAKIGRLSENLSLRFAAPFFLTLVVLFSLCIAGIYSLIIAIGFYLLNREILNGSLYFNIGRMTAEGMVLMVIVNFYCHAGIGYTPNNKIK